MRDTHLIWWWMNKNVWIINFPAVCRISRNDERTGDLLPVETVEMRITAPGWVYDWELDDDERPFLYVLVENSKASPYVVRNHLLRVPYYHVVLALELAVPTNNSILLHG